MSRSLYAGLIHILLYTYSSAAYAADQTALGLRDVKSPVDFPANSILFIIISFLVLGIFLILVKRLFLKAKPVKASKETDTRTPLEIAYAHLADLEKSSLLEEGRFKEYYSRLADIVRQYFENEFRIRAPEMTTEEFLWSLEQSGRFSADTNRILIQLMNVCDMVKFAKHIPCMEDGQKGLAIARQLIDQTRISREDEINPEL